MPGLRSLSGPGPGLVRFDPGEHASQVIEHPHQISELGIEVAHGTLIAAGSPGPLDLMAERVIPAAAKF